MSYQYGYAPQGPVRTDQRPQNGALVAIAWICAILTALYMLPWAIAATRGKSNQAMVGVVNLLVGWSFVGWIVALVMACTAHGVVAAPVAVLVAPAQQPAYGYPTNAQPALVLDASVSEQPQLPVVALRRDHPGRVVRVAEQPRP